MEILSLSEDEDCRMWVEGFGSPITLITGAPPSEVLHTAASLCARYSNAKRLPEVNVTVAKGEERFYLKVQPAAQEDIEKIRISMDSPLVPAGKS